MSQFDPIDRDSVYPINLAQVSSETMITVYERAVLATLFHANDADKVLELARQWGYQQEFLQSVWSDIHHNSFEAEEPSLQSRDSLG